jgi:hypothetical protein
METKILNEISKFRLYSNYNSSYTLTENVNVIQEQLGPEIKKLFATITKTGKSELKSFFKGKSLVDTLGNELKTVDDLIKAIDNEVLSEQSLKEIKTFFINNSKNKTYVDTLINNMVISDGFIKKYSKLTVDEAKKELIKKGYSTEKTQQIVNKFVENRNKFKTPAVELIQSEIKAINDALSELGKNEGKVISRDKRLRSFLDSAKEGIKKLDKNTIKELSLTQQNEIKAIEAALKQKSPSLWNEVTKYTHKLPKWFKVIGTIITVLVAGTATIGWDNAGKLVGYLLSMAGSAVKDFFKGFMEQITGNKTTPENTNDDMDKFKNFIISDWKSDYREGYVSFKKEGNYYVANDSSVNQDFYYIKNNNTFKYVPQQ